MREVEADLFMDLETAAVIAEWLRQRIEEMKKLRGEWPRRVRSDLRNGLAVRSETPLLGRLYVQLAGSVSTSREMESSRCFAYAAEGRCEAPTPATAPPATMIGTVASAST